MNIEQLRDFLFWCTLINFGVLLWWAAFFLLAPDFVYRVHSRLFIISRTQFDAIHYAGMAVYKLSIVFFNLVPYIALHILF
jgi:hypothetical protein